MISSADGTLTLDNIIKAVATVSMQWDVLGNKLAVPEFKLNEIRQLYPTDDLQKEALWKYWLEYMPNASWDTLAGRLFYTEEVSALLAVSNYTNKEPGIHINVLCGSCDRQFIVIGDYVHMVHHSIPYSRKSWRELYLADSLFLLFGGI